MFCVLPLSAFLSCDALSLTGDFLLLRRERKTYHLVYGTLLINDFDGEMRWQWQWHGWNGGGRTWRVKSDGVMTLWDMEAGGFLIHLLGDRYENYFESMI